MVLELNNKSVGGVLVSVHKLFYSVLNCDQKSLWRVRSQTFSLKISTCKLQVFIQHVPQFQWFTIPFGLFRSLQVWTFQNHPVTKPTKTTPMGSTKGPPEITTSAPPKSQRLFQRRLPLGSSTSKKRAIREGPRKSLFRGKGKAPLGDGFGVFDWVLQPMDSCWRGW